MERTPETVLTVLILLGVLLALISKNSGDKND